MELYVSTLIFRAQDNLHDGAPYWTPDKSLGLALKNETSDDSHPLVKFT